MKPKKNYKKIVLKTKELWLSRRGIGGSDAAALVGKSKWKTSNDIYNRLVLGKEQKFKENSRMIEGVKAEPHIRAMFALDHPTMRVINPPKSGYWLFYRTDYPLMTCTPDGLIEYNSKKYGLEIKDIELIKTSDKELWENNILPDDYYFQTLQYLVVHTELDGACLVAHLKYFKFNEKTKKFDFDYAIDKEFWLYREEVKEHVDYLEKKEISFIENNVEKRIRPKLKITI